jgi:hypothetical protein
MEIHVDALLDYIACPQLYKYRHVDGRDASLTPGGRVNRLSLMDTYDGILHQMIAFMFNTVYDGAIPTLHEISRKWGYLWVKPRSDKEDVRFKESSWRDSHNVKRTSGWEKLKKLYDHYEEAGWGTPIMVAFDYRIPVGKHFLRGRIDLARVIVLPGGRQAVEVVQFLADEPLTPFVHIRRDWRVTAASLAFRHLMNVSEEKIVYHGIISGKLQTTKRDETDFVQLEKLLDSVEHMIDHGIWYPRFDKRCKTCPYQKQCEKGG